MPLWKSLCGLFTVDEVTRRRDRATGGELQHGWSTIITDLYVQMQNNIMLTKDNHEVEMKRSRVKPLWLFRRNPMMGLQMWV